MNQIVLVGRLCKESELKYIAGSGTAKLINVIAVDRDYKKADGSKETDFINIEIMGKRAESLVNYLEKGKMISISGSLRINNYDKDGERRSFTSVNVDKLSFIPTGKREDNQPQFTPSFEPTGLDPNGWDFISDSEIPF